MSSFGSAVPWGIEDIHSLGKTDFLYNALNHAWIRSEDRWLADNLGLRVNYRLLYYRQVLNALPSRRECG